ncbi:hypothetical protein ASZ90_017713 [hydrocarbon metagenome]|uniref:Uncharacterized protein n=1 Tax=hydrocarbon metagenome TaxID=938273 RepID=A0A0W8E8Y4_9ZZZZ
MSFTGNGVIFEKIAYTLISDSANKINIRVIVCGRLDKDLSRHFIYLFEAYWNQNFRKKNIYG